MHRALNAADSYRVPGVTRAGVPPTIARFSPRIPFGRGARAQRRQWRSAHCGCSPLHLPSPPPPGGGVGVVCHSAMAWSRHTFRSERQYFVDLLLTDLRRARRRESMSRHQYSNMMAFSRPTGQTSHFPQLDNTMPWGSGGCVGSTGGGGRGLQAHEAP